VYYNALGHFSETWRDARFQQQILAAVRWTGRRP
jgi:type 1 glutamine amidotransferase